MNSNGLIHVLLVDDDDIFAMLLQESIAEHKNLDGRFRFERVSDGDQALDYLFGDDDREPEPYPDLIILDQRMPRMDGTAVLRELRGYEKTRSIPVCMLSTSGQPRLVDACYAAGANFCITKPGNFDELIEKVGHLLFFMVHVLEIPSRKKRAAPA